MKEKPTKEMKKQSFSDQVIAWQKLDGRNHLPWQKNPSQYRVWVSEIMLQQTQVVTVLKYYDRFIARFPDVKTLADTPLDEVLNKWSGLGYYRRAKLMHKAAQMIINNLDGHIPTSVEELMKLPGIGRSTAGAIVSLSLDRKAVILDANVKKILIRFHGIKSALNEKGIEKKLWQLAGQSLPDKEFRSYNQGLMDLGATICFKSKPKCDLCPLYSSCRARIEDITEIIPKKIKSKPPKKVLLKLTVFLNQKNQMLLIKQKENQLWAGLWHLPESKNRTQTLECAKEMFLAIQTEQVMTPFKYKVSNKECHVEVTIVKGQQKKPIPKKNDNMWFGFSEIADLGTSSLVRKIVSKMTGELLA